MTGDKIFEHRGTHFYFVKRGKVYHCRFLSEDTDADNRRKVTKSKTTKETNLSRAITKVKGWLDAGTVTTKPTALEPFLLEFWDFDKSLYLKKKQIGKKGGERTASKQKGVSQAYADAQLSIVKRLIVPYFKEQGITDLHELNTRTIDEWFVAIGSRDDVSARTLNRARQALFTALKQAAKWGLIPYAPTPIDKAEEPPSQRRPFSQSEMQKLLYDVAWLDERARVAVALAFDTGMRLGEVRGLRWHNVFDDGVAVVENYVDTEAHLYPDTRGCKPPKSNKARGEDVHLAISEYTAKGIESLRKLSPWKADPESFVFFNFDTAGAPISRDEITAGLDAAKKAAEITGKGKTFHSLRHAAISIWGPHMAPGERLAYFGHADFAIQDRYTHSTEEGREALRKVKGTILPFPKAGTA